MTLTIRWLNQIGTQCKVLKFQVFKVVKTWSTGVHVVIVCGLVDG